MVYTCIYNAGSVRFLDVWSKSGNARAVSFGCFIIFQVWYTCIALVRVTRWP